MKINAISNISGVINIPSKGTKALFFGKREKSNSAVQNSLDALAAIAKPAVKPTTIIPPKAFLFDITRRYIPTIPDDKKIELKYVGFEDWFPSIKKEYNPKTLKIINSPVKTEHISNFENPSGSVAISSTLDGKLSTDRIWQCAAVAFVDKSHNLQTLLHFCPYVDKKSNKNLLKYILSASKPEDLNVTIVPGKDYETDLTIDFLVDKISKYSKGCKLNYANFPDETNRTLILTNGKLFCTNADNADLTVNPANKLIYASAKEKIF